MQDELNETGMVDDYGRDHWKFSMDSLEFAYMLQPLCGQPNTERCETPDQITWVAVVADMPANVPADVVADMQAETVTAWGGPDGDREERDGRDGDRDGPEEGITMRVNDDGMRMSMAGDGSSISVEVGEDGMFLRMASALGLGASVGAGLAGLALNM